MPNQNQNQQQAPAQPTLTAQPTAQPGIQPNQQSTVNNQQQTTSNQQPAAQNPQAPPKKSGRPCLLACLITFIVLVILGILGWFVFRPMFFKWLCAKGAREQGIIKIEEDVYYNACLRKYHIIK